MKLNPGKIETIIGTLLLVVLILITQNLHSEDTGFKYFKNYSYWDYDHQPQNWDITQDKNGLIYVGNNGGLLEFDGVSWRLIDIPNYTVRSLALDDTGTVYIGGEDEFGYLTPDSKGFLQYVSLMEQVNHSKRDFSNVRQTHATKNSIYFCAKKFLFLWN